MKQKVCHILIFFFCMQSLHAQDKTSILNNTWSLQSGSFHLYDSYISPLDYNGFLVEWESSHSRFFKNKENKLSWDEKNTFTLGQTYNPTETASLSYLGIACGFGTKYHFRPTQNLIFTAGGFTDLALAGKYNNRNVNNPASVDFAWTLYATGSARYNLHFSNWGILFTYDLQTPLFGCMFIPEMGASYYELDLFGIKRNNFHVSSFLNKIGIKGEFNIDFLFKGFILRAGFVHEYKQWKGNNLLFKQERYAAHIGTVVDLAIFAGKKSEQKNPIWR